DGDALTLADDHVDPAQGFDHDRAVGLVVDLSERTELGDRGRNACGGVGRAVFEDGGRRGGGHGSYRSYRPDATLGCTSRRRGRAALGTADILGLFQLQPGEGGERVGGEVEELVEAGREHERPDLVGEGAELEGAAALGE